MKRHGVGRTLNISPGIIKGRRYSVYQPVRGSYPRPFLKGRTYAVGQEDTETAFGSRVWSYLMESYTTRKSLKATIVEENALGESVHRGIEDLRLLSLILEGKTPMPEFAVDSVKKAYKQNRDMAYSNNNGNVPMMSLLYLAHHGLPDTHDFPRPCIFSRYLSDLDDIAALVRRNCEDPAITEVASEMFIKLFTEEKGSRKSLCTKQQLEANFRARAYVNPYLLTPDKQETVYRAFGKALYNYDVYNQNKRIEDLIREEQRIDGINGASQVTFNIVELAMPIVHSRAKTRGYNASDFGVVPRYVSRYPWGPMFSIKAKGTGGGTVLIDNSGSMSYSPSEIAAIVKGAPASTIASYNGNGERGTLFILAKKGRMATPEAIGKAYIGCGNIVDYQSLLWLSMQEGPRIWITDGGVTGAYDRGYSEITQKCAELVKKHKINKCLEDVDGIIRILRGAR